MPLFEGTCEGLWGSFLVSSVAAVSFVLVVIILSKTNVLASYASRKLLHIGIGPIYVCCWRLFPLYFGPREVSLGAMCSPRCVASFLPGVITLVFAIIGLNLLPNDFGLVKVMSRSGTNPGEILRGPLIYGIVHVVLTLIFWVDHPAGILGLAMLCGGDGFAEISGRKWGHITGPIPWSKNRNKTIAGTLGFIVAGFITAKLMLYSCAAALAEQGFEQFQWTGSFADNMKLICLCIATSMVETIPVHEVDNAIVPLATVLLSLLLW